MNMNFLLAYLDQTRYANLLILQIFKMGTICLLYTSTVKTPVILVINKIDTVKKEDILKTIETYKDAYHFKEVIPVSAMKKTNTDTPVSYTHLATGRTLPRMVSLSLSSHWRSIPTSCSPDLISYPAASSMCVSPRT